MSRVIPLPGRSASVTDVAEVTRDYAVTEASDEATAISLFASYVSANSLEMIGGMILDQVDPKEDSQVDNLWTISATWRAFRLKEPTAAADSLAEASGEQDDWFDIGLSSEKIYKPIGAQVVHKKTADSGSLPSIALIGDQGDGKDPAGVELLVPEYTFGGTRWVKRSAWTESARNAIARLVGKTNSTAFAGWDIGEVLFAGFSGSRRGRDDVQLSFRFRVRENTTVSTDGFDDIDKLGWEYLWPRHKLYWDGTALQVTREIEHLVVATVFPSTSYSALE